MKKPLKYFAVSLSVAACIIVLIVIVYMRYFYYPNIQIRVSDLYNEPSRVVCISGDYYTIQSGNVVNLQNQEMIYKASDANAFAKIFSDMLWIIDNGNEKNLKAINSSGEVIRSYSIPKDITDFIINDNVIFCMFDDKLAMYRLHNDGTKEEMPIQYSFVYESDNSHKIPFTLYQYSCEYGTCLYFDMNFEGDKDSYYAISSDEKEIIGNIGNIQLTSFEKSNMIYTEAFFQLGSFFKYSFVNNKDECYAANLRHCRFFEKMPYYTDENNIVLVAQATTSRSIAKDGPVHYTDEMEKHKNDYLYLISRDNCETQVLYETKTFERILYADSEKAITYYDGEYLTYSLDGWKVINKQNADEIKENSSYTFEACGDYIFVFDDYTGEMINTIKV